MIFYVVAFVLTLLYVYFRLILGVAKSTRCLVGKTALVVGGSGGIGYEIVKNLATRGCRIIIADINTDPAIRKALVEETDNPNIILKYINLGCFKSVRQFAKEIYATEERLDILINNAGLLKGPSTPTADGLNPVMQVNYFAPFLLVHLLLDLLKKSAPSRIVLTSSCSAFTETLTLDNLNYPLKDIDNWKSTLEIYGNSKLAVLIATRYFAEKLRDTGVTCNSLHPGLLKTRFYLQMFHESSSLIIKILYVIFLSIFGKTPWEGAQTTLHLAIDKDVENVTGGYFWDCRPFWMPRKIQDSEFCEKIINTTKIYVGVQEN